MNVVELLTELSALGVVLEAKSKWLKVDAPKGGVTRELRESLTAHDEDYVKRYCLDQEREPKDARKKSRRKGA